MTQANDKKLFLLDAMALIYRSYFAFSKNPLINSKGVNTSAIYGFTDTLTDLINKENPTHIAVAFDALAVTTRQEEHSFYKANRQAMPEDIRSSIPVIKQIIEAMHIPILEVNGYEADDIIGTIAKKAEKEGYITYMVTPDKDFGQLVSDKILMYKPSYMGKGVDILGVPEVLKKWGIKEIHQVIDMLGLQGDASDNIPGIPGVGPKTAQKLIAEYGSVENILQNVDQLKGSLQSKVAENREQAIISKQLATIICDVPVEFDERHFLREKPDKEKIKALFAELEFKGLAKKMLGEEVDVATGRTGQQIDLFDSPELQQQAKENISGKLGKSLEDTPHQYYVADTKDKRADLIAKLLKQQSFAFDTETDDVDANKCSMVGLSFCFKPHEAYYVPLSEENCGEILQEFKAVFENEDIGKIGQNLKFDLMVLKWNGVEVKGKLFDTMLAHYLIEPEMRHNMDYLSETYLGYKPKPIEELIGKKGKGQLSMKDVPLGQIAEYAAEDADITYQLHEVFAPVVRQKKAEKLLHEIELPLIQVLSDMEKAGVGIDINMLAVFSKELEENIGTAEDAVFSISGAKFNLSSPRQLGEVLFEKMKIPYKGKKTKSGQYSTSEDKLMTLASEHEIIEKILEHRQLIKLKSTYVDALPKLINERSGRVHTSYNQAVVATGRLSSTNPNLQNIPIRTERGREIRKAFIPRSDKHLLLSADYSQVELRIVAAISGDEAMIEDFNKGLDIHSATAARVYGIPVEEVTSEMRRNAKMVNFGLIYGISAFGLSQRLGISRKEAAELIDQYFKKYSGIKRYMDEAIQKARDYGYAETMMGRRRYLRDITSRNATVRGFAERNAINAPIQGTAADMIKIAMVNIHKELRSRAMASQMILQVHDELVLDVPEAELEKVRAIVEERMKEAIALTVPVVVEMGSGKNWLEAH